MNEMPIEHYTADSMLRYNPLWAMILGERSVGKSFEFKKRSINTPNSIWIYLRRTDVLRKDPKNWKTYTSDLLQENAIDIDAEYKVNSEGIWVDGIQKVIFSALSTDSTAHSMNYLPDSMQETMQNKKANKKKNKQLTVDEDGIIEDNDYVIDDIIKAEATFDTKKPIAKKIVFEEMLEPKGKYLKNEVEQLFEFYVTVDRYTNTQLFGIANLMSRYSPYFDYFGIVPFTEEFRWFKDKTLLVQNVKIKAMESFVKQQRFYNLVKGTDYADYLTNNTPWQDDNFGIMSKSKEAKLAYNFRMHDKLFGIWYDKKYLYISTKANPQYITYSGLKSFKDGDIALKKNEGAHKLINEFMEKGLIKYESIPVREVTYEMINGGYRNG